MKKNGFTFIELLVVITIIGVVFAAGIVSYTSISKNSRNARRKADLEAVRQALEMCRSIDKEYPSSISSSITCPVSATVVTLKSTPTDPKPCAGHEDGLYSYDPDFPAVGEYRLTADCYEGPIGPEPYSVTNP